MKTALEELIESLNELNDWGDLADSNYSMLHDLVTKAQEQRAELIKAVAVKSYKAGCFKAITDLTVVNQGADKLAEAYYNEVIKPKYEI